MRGSREAYEDRDRAHHRQQRLVRSVARAVEKELKKESDPQVRLASLTFELLGLRMKELLGLRWRDLSFEGNRLRIEESKTETGERSLFVPSILLSEVQAHPIPLSPQPLIKIFRNVVNGNLQCKGERTSVDRGGNLVGGNKDDQCARF